MHGPLSWGYGRPRVSDSPAAVPIVTAKLFHLRTRERGNGGRRRHNASQTKLGRTVPARPFHARRPGDHRGRSLALGECGDGRSAGVGSAWSRLRTRSASRTATSPGWWQGGTCDPANYPGSHPLGASWHGLVACGPGPTQGGSDHLVEFYPGAWGELEWECVELSMRWMYLAWGVNPYPADGWDVVSNYGAASERLQPDGPQLDVVSNGTLGAVPQPGDVISVARTVQDGFGHTAVVTANAVNAAGDGTITVIQQNGGPGNDGWATYPVSNWTVGDGVSGWLHNPAWSFQRPVVGYSGSNGFEARVAAPGNSYQSARDRDERCGRRRRHRGCGHQRRRDLRLCRQQRRLLRQARLVGRLERS